MACGRFKVSRPVVPVTVTSTSGSTSSLVASVTAASRRPTVVSGRRTESGVLFDGHLHPGDVTGDDGGDEFLVNFLPEV